MRLSLADRVAQGSMAALHIYKLLLLGSLVALAAWLIAGASISMWLGLVVGFLDQLQPGQRFY